jgi:hypothetical protein
MRERTAAGRFLDTAALLAPSDVSVSATGQAREIAPGWQLKVVSSADNYLLSIKDTVDPCHFAYFSDDTGLIYTAQPMR